MTVDISSILWMVCSASIEDKDDVNDIGNRILGDWDINWCAHVALPVPGLPQFRPAGYAVAYLSDCPISGRAPAH